MHRHFSLKENRERKRRLQLPSDNLCSSSSSLTFNICKTFIPGAITILNNVCHLNLYSGLMVSEFMIFLILSDIFLLWWIINLYFIYDTEWRLVYRQASNAAITLTYNATCVMASQHHDMCDSLMDAFLCGYWIWQLQRKQTLVLWF